MWVGCSERIAERQHPAIRPIMAGEPLLDSNGNPLRIGSFVTKDGQYTMASSSNNDAVGMQPPYWRINRQAWEKPTIAGFIMPGRVTLASFKFGLKVQEGSASGKDGGKTIIRGLNLPRAQFTMEVDTGDDYFMADKIMRTVMPIVQPSARDLYSVYHPTLARYKFNACLVENIEETPPNNGGPIIFKLYLIVVFSRDNATHTPVKTGNTTGATGNAQTIALNGNVNRIKDVRDRPTDGGGRPTVP